MKKIKYISLIIMCLCSLEGLAQKGFKESIKEATQKVKPDFTYVQLQRARNLRKEDPTAAIKLIESIITNKKDRPSSTLLGEAYILLGNIYEDTDQKKLALERYNQARNLLEKTKDSRLQALNLYYIGKLQIDEGKTKSAIQNFNRCLKITTDKFVLMKCEEGLADLDLAEKNYTQSFEAYNNIQSNYGKSLDSLTNAQIEAKKSQAVISKDFDLASTNYSYAINSIPNESISTKDLEPIQKAQELLLSNAENVDQKIVILEKDLAATSPLPVPSAYIVSNQLELADLYMEKDDTDNAEKYIQAAKDFLKGKNNPEQSANIFRKDIKIQSRKGAYEKAAQNYESFNSAQDLAIVEKEKKLDDLVAVLENQRKIDIVGKDLEIKAKDEQLVDNQLTTQRYIIGLLSLLLLASVASFYFIMRNVRAKRKANSLLLLKSLRTQMNPHFIFNALNSVNNYISQNDERAANKFLTDFSKLMRMVLDYSQKDFIPFEDEVNLIELYLKLEHSRFKDKFDYEIDKDEDINYSGVDIPPMLIQPFIENAVWHGLRYKKEKGKLFLSIQQQAEKIIITVKDNGIGRAKSKTLKTKNQKQYKSTGLQNVDKRLHLINDIYAKNYEIKVADVDAEKEETGTLVEITI